MKKRTGEILELLDEKYGTEFICYLNYETPWQLLIATMLSAQCTDARVNIVTKDLFRKYPSVEAFADADLKELEQDIKPTGFYHNKAKNIIACMKDIRDKYNGEVPSELEDLLSLAGVGRKTANVIRCDAGGTVERSLEKTKQNTRLEWKWNAGLCTGRRRRITF